MHEGEGGCAHRASLPRLAIAAREGVLASIGSTFVPPLGSREGGARDAKREAWRGGPASMQPTWIIILKGGKLTWVLWDQRVAFLTSDLLQTEKFCSWIVFCKVKKAPVGRRLLGIGSFLKPPPIEQERQQQQQMTQANEFQQLIQQLSRDPCKSLHAGAAWSMYMQYLGQKGADCPCGNMRET
eukprot:1145819-Pelagomonas_calceolata.AAC.6